MRRTTAIRWTMFVGALGGACGCGESRETSAGGVPAAQADAGTALRDAAASEEADARVDGAPVAACVPSPGPDEPDDDFVDSNCDGIDGEVERAVFVSPSGSDSGDGTLSRPLRTLAQAVSRAAGLGRDVYVCDGTYAETLHLAGAAPSVHGGYDCTSGARHLARATIAPPSGAALTLTTVTKPVVVDHLAFHAADATAPSESSIAVTVVQSKDVTLSELDVVAGAGADGAPGAVPETRFPTLFAARVGADAPTMGPCKAGHAGGNPSPSSPAECALHASGGWGPSVSCPSGSLVLGGTGGDGGNFALALAPTDGDNGLPTAGDAVMDGSDGSRGRNGAPGGALGSVREGAYVADNDGEAAGFGASGSSGHGGRGGSSAVGAGDVVRPFEVGSGGGQGGYAGCGGRGGLPGRGAGASIGVLSDDSQVVLNWVSITTGRGGRGGDGSDGNDGQAGDIGAAAGASASPASAGRSGGRGGHGGPGGAGGPGGGGPSLGILARRTRPSLVAVTFDLGLPGNGGVSSAVTASDGKGAETVVLDEGAGVSDAGETTDAARGGGDGGAP